MLMPSGSPLTLFLCPSPLLLHTPPCSRSQVTLRLCGFYTHTHACTQAHRHTHTRTHILLACGICVFVGFYGVTGGGSGEA